MIIFFFLIEVWIRKSSKFTRLWWKNHQNPSFMKKIMWSSFERPNLSPMKHRKKRVSTILLHYLSCISLILLRIFIILSPKSSDFRSHSVFIKKSEMKENSNFIALFNVHVFYLKTAISHYSSALTLQNFVEFSWKLYHILKLYSEGFNKILGTFCNNTRKIDQK